MAELAQRFRFNLSDAFPGHCKILSHLFQRVIGLFSDSETHPQYLLLPGSEGGQGLSGLFTEVEIDDRIHR